MCCMNYYYRRTTSIVLCELRVEIHKSRNAQTSICVTHITSRNIAFVLCELQVEMNKQTSFAFTFCMIGCLCILLSKVSTSCNK